MNLNSISELISEAEKLICEKIKEMNPEDMKRANDLKKEVQGKSPEELMNIRKNLEKDA